MNDLNLPGLDRWLDSPLEREVVEEDPDEQADDPCLEEDFEEDQG